MSVKAGGIIADFELNAAGFENGLRKAQRNLSTNATRMNRALAKVERSFDGVGKGVARFVKSTVSLKGALAGLIGAGGFIAATKMALDFGDNVAKTADRVGVSTSALQEWRHAADLAGLSQKLMDDGLQRLNRRIGLFLNDGGGPAAKAFERLGIAGDIASRKLQGTEPVFDEIVKRLAEIDSQAERSAIASLAFGEDAGPKLVALLDQGTEGIERMRQHARDLGIVLDEKLLRNAEAAKDQLATLGRILKTQVVGALLEAAPIIAEFGKGLAERLPGLIRQMRDFAVSIGLVERSFDISEKIAGNASAMGKQVAELARLRDAHAKLAADMDETGRRFVLERTADGKGAMVDRPAALQALEGEIALAERKVDIFKTIGDELQREQQRQQDILNRPAAVIPSGGGISGAQAKSDEDDDKDEAAAAAKRAASDLKFANMIGRTLEREKKQTQRENKDFAREMERAIEDAHQAELDRARDLEQSWRSTSDALAGLVTGTSTWKDVATAAIGAVMQELSKLAATWLTAGSGAGAGGSVLGGVFSGVGDFLGGLFDGVKLFHDGGVAGGPAPAHSGPLRSDEVPAILQRGETVIPRGGSAGGAVSIVQNFSIDATGNDDIEPRMRAAVEQAARLGEQRAVETVARLSNQGGSYARTVGRRR